MTFNADQKAAVEKALDDRVPNWKSCPQCGQESVVTDWVARLRMTEPLGAAPEAGQPSDVNAPSVLVICTHCGLMRMFNVYALGLGVLVGPNLEEQKRQAAQAPQGEPAKVEETSGGA